MISIMRGEVYLEEEHIQLIKDEEEYVEQRYFAVARTEQIRITRKEAAEVLGLSVRQIKRIGSGGGNRGIKEEIQQAHT